MQRTRRVTLADVAARAGVSVATASVAITGRPSGNCRVSPAVAEKIRAAARELNYRPNLQARNLSTQRTRTIAFVIKRAAWHNAMFFLSPAQQVLRQRGYIEMVMLQPDDTIKSEREHLDMCVERQVEGILTTPLIDLEGRTNADSFNRLLHEEKIPIVQLGLALPDCAAPSVITDEVGGFQKGVTLLHAMGHRRIACLNIAGYDNPSPLNPFRIAHFRHMGYRQGMAKLGLSEQVFCSSRRCTDQTSLFEESVKLAKEIASANPRPTAILAFSDQCGAGLMAGLLDEGINVPGDISVVGVGGQLFGRMLKPQLTVLCPPFEKMAQIATETLLAMIEGAPGSSAALLPDLCMRESARELRP